MRRDSLDLYHKYFTDRDFERRELFQLLAGKFNIQRVLYPGSFVHITPSFVFRQVVYVDQDKQARKFFSSPDFREFVARRKSYPQDALITFHFADYNKGFDEPDQSFDLLVSQYAGFVGQSCKRYLKTGGILLANNSHGDAGVAAVDDDYELIAVFFAGKNIHRISQTNLDQYFIPKSSAIQITREYLLGLKKGIGYKRSASAYLFRRID